MSAQWSPSAEYLQHHPEIFSTHRVSPEMCDLIYNTLIPLEQRYSDKHVVFYHGQERHFLLYYDFQRKFKEALGHIISSDFQFLRNDFYNESDSVNEFLKNNNYRISDHNERIRKILLSCSLSFPGNALPAENAYGFFENSVNVYSLDFIKLLEEIVLRIVDQRRLLNVNKLKSMYLTYREKNFINNFRKKLRELFILLWEDPSITGGVLLQIFVPNDIVSNYAFFSQIYGQPCDDISDMREEYAATPYGMMLQKIILPPDPAALITAAKVKELIQSNKEGLQARLLLHEKLFNPSDSPLIIKVHHMIPPHILEEYEQKVDELVSLCITHLRV